MQKAQAALEEVQREIDGLRLKRRDVGETRWRGPSRPCATRWSSCASRSQKEREDKVLLHRPRRVEPPALPRCASSTS